jgi:flagella basal body P-ring formation protein FlgA
MRGMVLALILFAQTAMADSIVATRTIRAQTVLTAEDFTTVAAEIPGAMTDPAQVIGQEARVTMYAGRPILAANLGAAALVDRNQMVSLVFRSSGLTILTEGRALDRGGVGDVIKVMNLASRTTVTGTIAPDGSVMVNTGNEGSR